ncbi:MAG: T9SS type A sorting domain-containing protein [Saprospiraceae bacterium]
MKQILILFIFVVPSLISAQTVDVVSTDGYTVHITLSPFSIVPINSCNTGNYMVDLPYNISFTGSNIPSSLYTLQGTIDCSSAANIFFDLPNNGGAGTSNSSTASTDNNQCGAVTCSTIHIMIEGPGISNRTIDISGTRLAIALTMFNVASVNNSIKIHWSSLASINSKGYDIERSADLKNWKRLETYTSNHSLDQYEYLDLYPLNPVSYYRIKSIDIDGSFIYSTVKSVRTFSRKLISLYPNPVKHILTLEPTQVDATYSISDLMGRIIETKTTSDRQTNIGVDHLRSGMYMIQYAGSTGMFIKE